MCVLPEEGKYILTLIKLPLKQSVGGPDKPTVNVGRQLLFLKDWVPNCMPVSMGK